MLFSLAEIKLIQSNHRVFKAINQSESTTNGHAIFNKFIVNQSKLSSILKNVSLILKSNNRNWIFFLVSLFVGNQSNQNPAFSKSALFINF